MKRSSFLLAVMLTIASFNLAHSQDVVIMPMVESTMAGAQAGMVMAFKTKKDWMTGVFYLTGIRKPVTDTEGRQRLYGITSSLPLIRTTKIVFAINARVGISNERFLVVIPGVDTRIAARPKINVVIGSGWRYGHPSISGAISFKL